jgi:AcrR family transcriptional regulator
VAKEYDERRREIIETAASLFSEHGYDETSVSMIINSIGIAKGTFYHYFTSKDEVLEVIVDLMVEKVGKGVEEISRNDTQTALEKMGESSKFFRTVAIGWERINEFLHEDRNAHWHLKLEKKLLPIVYDSYERIIRQGIEEGVFHVDYPKETAIALLGSSMALNEGDHDHTNRGGVDHDFIKAHVDISERLLGMEKGEMLDLYQKTMEELKWMRKEK